MSTAEWTDADIKREVVRLASRAGLPLSVEVTKGVVTLEGLVLSEDEKDAAIDLAAFVPGVTNVTDAIEVMDLEEEQPNVLFGMPTRPDEWEGISSLIDNEDTSVDEITTSDPGGVDDDLTSDERVAVEEGMAYFPPTDPPVDMASAPDGIEVASGFQFTAMDEEVEDEGTEHEVRDAEIVDMVIRELNEDAATTHLNIHVASANAVVFLTGFISDPNDADEAAAVAERVEGVRRVVERLITGESPTVIRRPPVRRTSRTQQRQVAVPGTAWRSTVARNEQWLLRERAKVREQVATRREELEAFGRDQAQEGSVSNHQGDIGSDVTSAEVLNSEITHMEDELDAIDEALLMMKDGRYGVCVTCGQLIDPARLRANPLAIRDIQHQQEFEDQAGASMDDAQRRGIG